MGHQGILGSIIWFSLRRRAVIVTLAAMLFAYGLLPLSRAKFDVFPEFAPPQVSLRLEAPGLSPEQVENLVTSPVERALAGVEGVKTIRSHSLQGIAAVTVIFHDGTNIYRARQLVTERLASMSEPLPPGDRTKVSTIARLPLRNAAGTYVFLGEVADIQETGGRYEILHLDGRRVQVITCNVAGGATAAFVNQARKRIRAAVTLPAGSYIEFTGTAEAAARARRQLLFRALLAGLGIILLLSVTLHHYRNVLLVLLNLPFALVGGVGILLLTGTILSLGAMVGFITLFGITLRNSLMLISHYQHLVAREGLSWSAATARRGASERLAPILMTALVTGLGLLPLVIGLHTAGREIEGPMALVILGGLVTSTALNLLILPTLAARWGRFAGLESRPVD